MKLILCFICFDNDIDRKEESINFGGKGKQTNFLYFASNTPTVKSQWLATFLTQSYLLPYAL